MLLPALFAGFSLVAMVLLHLGLYRPALVLPLGLLAAAAAGLGVGLVRPEPLAGNRLLDGAAVLVTLGFAALNVRYSAQNISVFRDPAAYAVTGQWLVHHGSLPIPVEAEVFGAVPGVSLYSAAFDPGPAAGFVYPQYGNLVPRDIATREIFDVCVNDGLSVDAELRPRQTGTLHIERRDGRREALPITVRIDTPIEVAYFAAGGILPYMLQRLLDPASDRASR